MAFPINGLLDDLSGGAAALTSRGGWGSGTLITGGGSYSTDGAGSASAAGGSDGNYWATTAADCEAWATLSTWTPASSTWAILARITAIGSLTAYGIRLALSSATSFQLCRIVTGTITNIGSATPQAVAVGDSVGISVVGSQVTSYYRSGAGAWTQMDTVADNTITGAGFVGGFRNHTATTTGITDFGGGSLDPIIIPVSPRPFASWTIRAAGN